jgi:phage tail sheath protein FI
MPEYLAPGVYIEEVSFRSKSIEGVSTTTTGLIGASRYGPIDLPPDVLTSVGEFERVYGGRQQLQFGGGTVLHNYLWHAVRGFFEEGGKRLYVSRVFRPLTGTYPPADFSAARQTAHGLYDDGHARATVPTTGGAGELLVRARFPGDAGNMLVRFTVRLGPNILGGRPGAPTLGALHAGDLVWINDVNSPIDSPPGSGTLYLAESFYDTTARQQKWRFHGGGSPASIRNVVDLVPDPDPARSDNVRTVTLTVSVVPNDGVGLPLVWSELAPDPTHQRNGAADSLSAHFAEIPSNLGQARSLPIVITTSAGVGNGIDVVNALVAANTNLSRALADPRSTDAQRSVDILLSGGNDGARPLATDYEGLAEPDRTTKTGLKAFEDIDDIAIVAAPGSTFGYENGYRDDARTIMSLLIGHATLMRYRIAVLDSGEGQSIAQVRAMRGQIDTNYAALYYPWVRILDPVTRAEIAVPPSGFVSGIFARNDVTRAVYKAPANEVVTLALGFELMLNKAQQDVLNPEGVNCFRFFEGRGFRLWGARLASSDPEWKYVNLRRYFAYLEHSIDRGTQWAVFEPNGEALWANVRRTIEGFLLNEWQGGALLGDKPDKAYFVRCDRSTMTQNDLDNGRLVVLVGVAPLRPAEFVIFRIGQWTADRTT